MAISKRKTLTDSLNDLRGTNTTGIDIENDKYKKPFVVTDFNHKKRLTLNDMRDDGEQQENMRSIPFENEYENMTKQGTAMMMEFNKRIKLFGFPCYYITARDIKREQSQIMSRKFNYADAVKLYFLPENLDGWEAEKETLFEQGLGIFDEGTLITTKWLWYEARVKNIRDETIDMLPTRPVEGDLIYHALSQKLYGIRFVDRDMPFYPLGIAPQWNIKIESYEQRNSDVFEGFEGLETETKLSILFKDLQNRDATIRTVDMSNERYDKVGQKIIEDAKDIGAEVTDLLQNPVEDGVVEGEEEDNENQNNIDEKYYEFGDDWKKDY